MEECARAMQQRLCAAPSIKKRAKSVYYQQRNLWTIKDRKREKKEEKEVGGVSGETIMCILRMRYVSSTQPSGFLILSIH